jgi:GTP-binding protein
MHHPIQYILLSSLVIISATGFHVVNDGRTRRIHNKPQTTLWAKRNNPVGNKKKKTNANSNANSNVNAKPPRSPPSSSETKRPSKRTPPWQVLSDKDAKKNVVKEIQRRELAKQGIHQQQPEDKDHVVLSKSFLSGTQQRLINWKRFNPTVVPAGMRFVGSYLDQRLPPKLGVPEIAFLGRSNVGKSSLLNQLSARASSASSDTARVGKTPGATASVNLYTLVDLKGRDILGWADLPGFGYAKLSKEVKESIQESAEHYLEKRKELMLGILLVDIRRDTSDNDKAVLAALFDMGLPIVVVATKADKVKGDQRSKCLEQIRFSLGLPDGQPLAVSSATGEGCRDLWRIILDASETGVSEFKQRYNPEEEDDDDDDDDDEEEEMQKEVFVFSDGDDLQYNQGYDWIHSDDSSVMYEGGGDYDAVWDEYEEEQELDEQDEPVLQEQPKENIKSLRRRAKDMEKKGQV